MTSRKVKYQTLVAFVAGGLTVIGALTGCESEPPPQVVTAPPESPPPPPPPKPLVTPISELMVQLAIDERVKLAESKAPASNAERVAVLEFFDAFVRGDVDTLNSHLRFAEQNELRNLAATDDWKSTIAGITEVTVETGPSPIGSEQCALAIFESKGDFQPQLWYFFSEEGDFVFEAVATPPNIMDRLYGENWIARWHDLLKEEMELANKMDEKVEPVKVDISSEREGGSAGGGGPPSPGSTPLAPSPGGPSRPVPPPRRPPSPG